MTRNDAKKLLVKLNPYVRNEPGLTNWTRLNDWLTGWVGRNKGTPVNRTNGGTMNLGPLQCNLYNYPTHEREVELNFRIGLLSWRIGTHQIALWWNQSPLFSFRRGYQDPQTSVCRHGGCVHGGNNARSN